MGVKPAPVFAAWPKLMSLEILAAYSSIAASTWRDYVRDNLIEPVRMPGSTLRDPSGRIVSRARDRRINKLLFDKDDVDVFIGRMKGRG